MSGVRGVLWGLLAGVLLVADTDAVVGATPPDSNLRYALEVAPGLGSVTVEAQFPIATRALRARAAGADDLLSLHDCAGQNLEYRLLAGGRLRLSRPAACVRYRALLRSADRGGVDESRVLLTNIRQWLWLPRQSLWQRVRVTVGLPSGMRASVPWHERVPGEFEFGPSPGSGDALALFGDFPQFTLSVAGHQLRVAVAAMDSAPAELKTWQSWLRVAAQDVVQVAGKFPNPDVQLLLVPGNETTAGSPVPFGHVIRDMGEAVRFFVEPNRSLPAYLEDWTASHEFAHLLLPFVDDKWVSEGFASYYQNTLLARRGAYSATQMWQRLTASFAKADAIADPPTLMGLQDEAFWRVRMLVYWSGAAIALLADARLRELSDGAESLDSVLAQITECCLPSARSLTGAQFFQLLDTKTAHPVFTGLYQQFAHASGQPSVAALLLDLGVVQDAKEGIRLVDEAPLAWVRHGIDGSLGAR